MQYDKYCMNYSSHYSKLITRAQQRTLSDDVDIEIHHIIPRCIGGTDEYTNLIALTPEEHLLAHILLTKIHDYEGLMYAVFRMLVSNYNEGTPRGSFNKRYGHWRRKALANNKGTKWWYRGDKSQRSKTCPGEDWLPGMANDPWNKDLKTGPCPAISAAKKGKPQPVKTENAMANSGHRNTIWWTNGTKNKRALVSPGQGWHQGFTGKKVGAKGMTWWNNGVISRTSLTCPEGFQKGRLPK